MTTYTFSPTSPSQTSYAWNNPAIWNPAVVPNAADADVVFPTITTSGGSIFNSLVNINSNQNFSVRSVSLTNNNLWVNGSIPTPASLTVSGDFAVHTGGDFRVIGGTLSAGSLENDGTVGGNGQINVAGLFSNHALLSSFNGPLTISAAGLTNTGTLVASSSDMTITVPGGGFTNLVGSTLTGGTYQTGTPFGAFSGTIHLNVGGMITTNATNILLYGGDIFSFDNSSSTYIPLESSLQSIAPSGLLTLAGRTFNWGSLSVEGALVLSTLPSAPNATLNSSSLIVAANGHVSGVGTIHAPVTNNGTITANALKLDGTVSGSGALEIVDGGTLELTGAASQTVMFLGDSGLLTLDNPASFTGTIVAAAPGDQINLAGISLSSVTGYHYSGNDSGGVLTIHLTGGDVQLNFSGHFSTQSFTLAAGDQPLSSSPPSLLITEHGFVSAPNDANAIPQRINDAGDIVGYYTDDNGIRHGFLKSAGTYVEVPIIGLASKAEFHGINDSGDIAGTVLGTAAFPGLSNGKQLVSGFIAQNNAVSIYDRFQPTSGDQQTVFQDINNQDTVVGYFTVVPQPFDPHFPGQKYSGFIFQNGSFQAIGPANNTLPYGLNDEGQVVGSFFGVGKDFLGLDVRLPSAGFLYDSGTGSFTTFTAPSSTQTFARDINDDGLIVGYYDSNSGTHGFAYDRATGVWTPIDAPGAVSTYIYGINDLDQIVGIYVDHAGVTHPFVSTVPPPFPAAAGNIDEWILSNGNWELTAGPGSHPAGFRVAAVADFTGNGVSDILWQNVTTGAVDLWKISQGAWAGSVDFGTHPGSGWQIAGAGDFNGDGTKDVFWFNPATGQTDIWQLANGQWAASLNPGSHPTGYQVAGIADFNHDGSDDILWFNPTTRHVDEWNLVNGLWAGSNNIGTHPGGGFQPAGVGDFNGDGTADVFWYNPSTNATDIWLLQNGTWSASVSLGNHPAGWNFAGIGDFNGDGTSDVLWYNPTTHATENWIISNAHWAGSNLLGVHPGPATIAGIGDFNGGGTSDILWHQFV